MSGQKFSSLKHQLINPQFHKGNKKERERAKESNKHAQGSSHIEKQQSKWGKI